MRVSRYVENTLQSQRQCLQLADGFEMDAISTADSNVVSTHADEVAQHILVDFEALEKYIGRMQTYQIREIPVGPEGKGRIPTFDDVLAMVQNEFPTKIINVELKGKIGNPEDDFTTSSSLGQLVAEDIKQANFPLNQVIFSSFSHRYLLDMHAVMPEAQLGILYEGVHPGQVFQPKPLYRQNDDFQQQLDYSAALSIPSLESTLQLIPSLYSVHAEISSLTPETVRWIAEHNLVLSTWAWQEHSPHGDTVNNHRARDNILNAVQLCQQGEIKELLVITDHVKDVRAVLHN